MIMLRMKCHTSSRFPPTLFLLAIVTIAPAQALPAEKLSSYKSLADAIAQIGSSETELWIDENAILTDNLTCPRSLALRCEKGKLITTTGYTLKIDGPFEVGLWRVFTGDGDVVFGPGTISVLRPEWWGAVPDDATDCHAPLQAAIKCQQQSGHVPIELAAGVYLTLSQLLIDGNSAAIQGAGKTSSAIKAGATMTALIAYPDSGKWKLRGRFERFHLDAQGKAEFGFYAPARPPAGGLSHSTFRTMRVTGAKTAAVHVNYGWCNLFDDLELTGNGGDGLVLGGSNNQNLVSGCKVFFNKGMGIKVYDSSAVKLLNTTIESNQVVGVYVRGGSGLSIDTCYFEANAKTGHRFETPPKVVKADIIINGASRDSTIAHAYPTFGCRIVSCLANSGGTDCFAFIPGAKNITIENNYTDNAIPIVATLDGDARREAAGIEIGNNAGFSELAQKQVSTAQRNE